MRTKRTALLLGPLLLLVAGCTDQESPTASIETSTLGAALLSISDGSHDGTEGFHFLPPMVDNRVYGGTFDGALQPEVEICETTACDASHASYSMTEGIGSEVVRLVEEDEHYIVNWHTNETGAVAGKTYRVRIVVSGVVLGHADVAVVSTGREAVWVQDDGLIALVANQTLPVKFRIETGIVGAVVVSPSEATIDVGETQQFSAELQDLHGEPLVGPVVTWSSDDEGVATVDADGLATGAATGEADISATAGQITGSATLTVVEEAADPAFVTTWDTSLGTGTTVTLALAGTVDATIDWGDGTVQDVTTAGPHVHGYGADGVYTVSVTGTVTAYNNWSNGGAISEREKLVSVDAWGETGFTSMVLAFHSASNLTTVPSTSGGIENVTNMGGMFVGASALDHPIGDWNTGSVTNMTSMFSGASAFNQPIGGWDTGSVTGMRFMFRGASSFNADLSGWCVSLITSEPDDFDTGANSWVLPRPDWGECP